MNNEPIQDVHPLLRGIIHFIEAKKKRKNRVCFIIAHNCPYFMRETTAYWGVNAARVFLSNGVSPVLDRKSPEGIIYLKDKNKSTLISYEDNDFK